MFNSKYPIVSVAMNQVSDINLAVAVAAAGGVPSLSIFNYMGDGPGVDTAKLIKDLDYYKDRINTGDLIFSMCPRSVRDLNWFLGMLNDYNITFIELLLDHPDDVKMAAKYKTDSTTILLKEHITTRIFQKYPYADGIIFKGPAAAGRVKHSIITLEDITSHMVAKYPDKIIIPSGGICSADQVKNLIDLGATAVGVGTLFAAAVESPLSVAAKNKLIDSTFADVTLLPTSAHGQNALVFSRTMNDVENNTIGLRNGIRTGTHGHIFAGQAIDSITEISTVQTILDDLGKLL